MGIALPQLAPASEDRVSGAQVIDGSLKFDKASSNYLKKTISTTGNQKTFTVSVWFKKYLNTTSQYLFTTEYTGSGSYFELTSNADQLHVYNSKSTEANVKLNRTFRDTSGWINAVIAIDTTIASPASDRVKIYVNGERQESFASSSFPAQDYTFELSNSRDWLIGTAEFSGSISGSSYDGHMSQFYFIDGQALDASYFGYTDALTNTWRPKKYTGTFTQTSFNNGTTWSSSLTSNGTLQNAGNAFDGDLSSRAQTQNAAADKTLTFAPPAINFTQKLEVYCDQGSAVPTATWNGNTVNPGGGAWVTVYTGSGTLSSTYPLVIDTETAPQYATLKGVRIDGEVLIDGLTGGGVNSFYLPMDGNSSIGEDKSRTGNNWTPVNFGGSVALDNPQVSGARPILNTDGGGNVARPGVFGSEENVGYAVTVYDDGGGNKYYIDGTKQATLNGLIRGATYTFDTSDSTLGSTHPFRLSATSAHGTEYTDGVVAITGAATTITVPHNAPNSLYYYCTAHSGMGSSITGITTNASLADPYAWKNVISLPLVGANSDVSNSVNSGSTTKVMTSVGNAAASSDTSNFYNGSFEFDGSGDGITCPDNTDFEFGSGDFTVECWVKQDDTSGFDVFVGKYGGSSDGEFIVGKNGNTPTFYWQDAGGNANINATNFTGNTSSWYHMACVREGNVFTMYINGICENSTTDATTIKTTSNKLTIGIENDSSSSPFDGYLQDVRIYKGVAKYSGTTVGTQYFVPASTSPDILPDTPSGVSGGSKLAKVTDGAVSFDGSGDYLSIADSSDLTVGTNPFTLEFYAYKTAAGEDFFCGSYDSSGTTASLSYAVQTGGSSPTNSLVAHVASGGSATSVNSGVDFVLNKWVHVAFVRDGNTLRLFQDGIQMSTAAFSATVNDASNAFEIGRAGFSGKDFPGYISNFRFVNGTALYTTDFTPPTRELTDVTNTKLLCCQSNTLAGSAAVTPVTGNTGYTGTSQSITLNQANLDAGTVANVVDGNTTTSADIRDAGSFVELIFPQQQNGELQVNVSNGNDVGDDNIRVFIDGVEGTAFDVSSQSWHTIHTGNFTTVKLEQQGSTTGNIFGFRIGTSGDTIISKSVAPVGNAAATNFNPFNTDINTVRGQETGYCTWNPLSKANINLSDGNLTAIPGANDQSCFATLSIPDNGKVYFEFTCIQRGGGGAQSPIWGVGNPSGVTLALNPQNSDNNASTWLYGGDGNKTGGGSGSTSYGTAFIAGDIIGVCVDRSNSRIWFSKNNVWQNGGNPNNPTDSNAAFTNVTSTGTLIPFYGNNNSTYGYGSVNFGQKPFKFPPPAGFQPLNAANTKPVKVFARPDHYVGVTTYTGITQSPRTISLPITPDLIWVKNRDTAKGHFLLDTVRGDNNNLRTDDTYNESAVNGSSHGILSTIGNNSFSVKDGSSTGDNVGSTGTDDYVAWFWKAGGNKNTFNVDDVGYASAAAAGLTGGSITPTGASVGTKQGFSIIKYTGNGNAATIPHGLSQTPTFLIKKFISASSNWDIWTPNIGADKRLVFSDAATSSTTSYQSVNASTFDVHAGNNDDTVTMIAYCWHDVPGLQKFGSYTGVNDADGPFLELGFRPSVIMFKNISSSSTEWVILDSKRNGFNGTAGNNILFPSTTGDENATQYGDFLSNGWKFRINSSYVNSTDTFIYAAWAEAPTFNLYGAQSNAR